MRAGASPLLPAMQHDVPAEAYESVLALKKVKREAADSAVRPEKSGKTAFFHETTGRML